MRLGLREMGFGLALGRGRGALKIACSVSCQLYVLADSLDAPVAMACSNLLPPSRQCKQTDGRLGGEPRLLQMQG